MPLRAANLGRVSKKDRKKKNERDRARSVAEQHTANEDAISANGHLEVSRYQDEESASRFATKAREDWDRLIGDIENDRIDILYIWESSRASRKLGEWVEFLDLCRSHNVLIHVTTHHTTYDMSNRRQRKSLIDDGVDNEDESEKTSERVRRTLKANREAGMPHGICKYGYQRVYHPRTGALLGQERVPEHAKICTEIITRVAQRDPNSVIADDLNRRGIPAPGGGVWHRRQISRIATSVAYIGKIRVDGELIDAKWPPISDQKNFEEIFWAAQHRSTDPKRKVTRPGRSKYLLSYLMRCDKCGSEIQGDPPRRRRITFKYTCRNNCSSVIMPDADAIVALAVVKKLSDETFYANLVQSDKDNVEQITRARAEAARLRAELDEWASADISAHAYSIREAKLMPLIEAAEKRAEELTVPLPLRDLTKPGEEIQARWDAMPIPARRDVIRLLFPDLRLLPGKTPADERIVLGTAELTGLASSQV